MKISSVVIDELNPFANPGFAHDGGGYSQPKTVVTVQDGSDTYVLEIVDTSCGDFGKRIWKNLMLDGRTIFESDIDEMAGQELTVNISGKHDEVLVILNEAGYINDHELELLKNKGSN